jgi:hypothetical protein
MVTIARYPIARATINKQTNKQPTKRKIMLQDRSECRQVGNKDRSTGWQVNRLTSLKKDTFIYIEMLHFVWFVEPKKWNIVFVVGVSQYTGISVLCTAIRNKSRSYCDKCYMYILASSDTSTLCYYHFLCRLLLLQKKKLIRIPVTSELHINHFISPYSDHRMYCLQVGEQRSACG